MYLCKNGREINVTKYGELFIVQKALKLMHLKIVNFYRQTDQKKMLPKNEQKEINALDNGENKKSEKCVLNKW